VLIGSSAGLTEYQELLSIQRHHGYEVTEPSWILKAQKHFRK